MADEALIRIEHLCKEYETDAGPVPVLKDVNIAIRPGEFVAIMGPSGSGKSTFMNILGCLDLPTSGRYMLDGRDVGTLDADELAQLRNRVIGFVFQGFNLLPRATLATTSRCRLIYAGVATRGPHARRRGALLDEGRARRLPRLRYRTRFPAASSSASPSRARWSTGRG